MKNKPLIYLLFTALIVYWGMGCSQPKNNTDFSPFTEPVFVGLIEPILIRQGSNFHNYRVGLSRDVPCDDGKELTLIITTQSEWSQFLSNLDEYARDDFTKITIDFNQFTVIGVIDELKCYTGYSIDIMSVSEYEDRIIVKVDKLLKGGIGAAHTRPFHIVKIPKTTKKIRFEHLD